MTENPALQTTFATAQTFQVDADCLVPFETIGLAFSGGGFRAASFALGVLSYLNQLSYSDVQEARQKTLLQNVTYMSSASGGTIATALFGLYHGLDKPFSDYYKKLHTELSGEAILKNALQNLVNADVWKGPIYKQRTIINAFALAYDKCLFDGATIQDLIPKNPDSGHLEEICFNATELFRGLLFRQQIALKQVNEDKLLFGNYVVHLKKEAAYKLKLGDVLAASSCFPGGFEPILFPNDFANSTVTPDELKKSLEMCSQTSDTSEEEFVKNKTFGLMDGGITDNQGLESLMQADQRRYAKEVSFKPFSIMLVNDVCSQFIDPYIQPTFKSKSFWNILTINVIKILLALVVIASIFGSWYFIHELPRLFAIFLLSVTIFIGSFSLFFLASLLYVQSSLKGSLNPQSNFNLSKTFSTGIVKSLLTFLNQTALRIVMNLIKERIRSVLMLVNDLFLKRIRYLLYESFYTSLQWRNRGKGNHVYDLSFTNDLNRKQHPSNPPLPASYNPTKAIQTVAQVAFTTGTALWFDVNAQNQCHYEASLIACGQFTTCYNLLEYIWRLEHNNKYKDLPDIHKNRIATIKGQLLNDYEKFKIDPFYLYNQLGNEYNLPDFDSIVWTEIKLSWY